MLICGQKYLIVKLIKYKIHIIIAINVSYQTTYLVFRNVHIVSVIQTPRFNGTLMAFDRSKQMEII